MIVVNPMSLMPIVLVHRGCGGYVERSKKIPWKQWPIYSCPSCDSLVHPSAVVQKIWSPPS